MMVRLMSQPLVVKPDGDGAAVDEVNRHVGAEAAGRDRGARLAQAGAEVS